MKSDIAHELLLSICIPTFNRKGLLMKTLHELQKIQRSDVEFVVIDDLSTDGTREELEKIEDKRLRVVVKKEKAHAHQTMIDAIWAGKGRYILYCNDRDILFADKVEKLMKTLEQDEYSYVHVSKLKGVKGNSGNLHVYQAGADSLLHQNLTHHPTGTVYNGEILRNRIKERQPYICFRENSCYSWDLLMTDLVWYAKSAEYDLGIYDEPGRDFYVTQISKAKTGKRSFYGDYTFQKELMVRFCGHVGGKCEKNLSPKDRQKVYSKIITYFTENIIGYKFASMDEAVMGYYGLEAKLVNTRKVLAIIRGFSIIRKDLCRKYGFYYSLTRRWQSFWKIVSWSLYGDIKYYVFRLKRKEIIAT